MKKSFASNLIILCLGLLSLSAGAAPVYASWYSECTEENAALTTCSDSWWNGVSRCCRERNDKCRIAAGTSQAAKAACTTSLQNCTGSLSIFYSTNCPASVTTSNISISNDKSRSYLCVGGSKLQWVQVEVPNVPDRSQR